ncbi:MAG: SpaA isopeptide-forming pilin-related protein [Cyclobacteriaceae bacterium]
MKTQKFAAFALVALILLGVFAFSPADDGFLPTRLRVTVIDGLGNFVEGATVKIYSTEDDYRASENAVGTMTTDEKGRVKFKELEPISYFIDARKDDLNNDAEGVKTAPLEEGQLNKVNTIIE